MLSRLGSWRTNNPGTHAFSENLYEFSSAAANNGSGFEGLGDTYGFNDNPSPAPFSPHWDIATGLVMIFSRYIPMIVPLAIAGSVAMKKPTPVTSGTLNTNTFTFGCMLLGTVLILAALLFFPAGAWGPLLSTLGRCPSAALSKIRSNTQLVLDEVENMSTTIQDIPQRPSLVPEDHTPGRSESRRASLFATTCCAKL